MFEITDNNNPKSWASKCRRRRVKAFIDLLEVTEETRVLDIGGTSVFWRNNGVVGNITILNRDEPASDGDASFVYVQGDARDISQFGDGDFDVVFSNSVIEHVGNAVDQEKMAHEVRRVGQGYFVQVPNRNFPIEPHFLFPAFQFLPRHLRCFVARHWPYGWFQAGSAEALHAAEHVRLLTCPELSGLFPDAVILGESFWLFNKSLIAVRAPNRISDYPGFRVLCGPRGQRARSVC